MQDDPKLWMVKVRAGSEKAIVALLMSRFLAERLKNKPWGVTSAFCQEMPPRTFLALTTLAPTPLYPASCVSARGCALLQRFGPLLQRNTLALHDERQGGKPLRINAPKS